MIWTPAAAIHERVPKVALRMLPPPDRHSVAGLGANAYGTITSAIRPLKLHIGADGNTLECRVRGDYAVSSDLDYMHTSLAGWWATLEYRPNSNNRALQKVLFRGVVSSEGHQMSGTENGVDATFWDRLALADDVVELYSDYLCLGAVLSRIDAMDIWPKDASGNRVGGIDPELFGRMEWSGMKSIDGIPTPQAFEMLFRNQKGDLPTIKYDGGKLLLSVRKRGEKKRALVAPVIRVTLGTKRFDITLRELRGIKDFSRMVTRIKGRGDLTRKADTATLTPAWDRSLDTAVLRDPSLPDTDPVYADVGRRYLIPAALWPYNAESGAKDTFEPELWGRRNSTDDWMPMENDGRIEGDASASVDPLMGRASGGYTNGQDRYYRFSSTHIWDDYTEAQKAQREAGTFVDPSNGFMEMQLTATYQESILQYDTGYVGDEPVRRIRILRNKNYSKMSVGEFFRRLGTAVKGRVSATPALYDHLPALINECLDAIEVSQNPFISFSAIMPESDFEVGRGDEITEMYDRDGSMLVENMKWFVEDIDLPLNTGEEGAFTTELQFDNAIQELLGGLLVS